MSDGFPAEITIGGKIPVSLREGLAEALEQDGAKLDWDKELSKNEIIEMIDNEDTPCFTNDQACNGSFQETLSFCREKRSIDFDHYSDAYAEYDGEAIIYRDGEELTFLRSQNGQLLVSYDKVRKVINDIMKNSFLKILILLEEIAPDFKPLEPIEWTK